MRKLLFLLTAITLPMFHMSCEKQTGSGIMNLSITDSPIDTSNVAGVFITINEIQVHSSDSNWLTMENFVGPKAYNLMNLTRGVSDILGNISLAGRKYSQIRFMLDAPVSGTRKPVNPGCYIEFKDGSTEPLFVPSSSQSGFKAVGEFIVPVNGSIDITADFDIRKSVIKTGSSSSLYILKPVIRLIVNNEAGQIRGNVINIPAGIGIVVYAYSSGTYKDEEANTPADESTRFPNAVSSDKVDDLGVYHIAYLAEGKYDLIVTSLVNNSFIEVLGRINDVSVESLKTTKHDIDITSLK
jgi:hypothetical protein